MNIAKADKIAAQFEVSFELDSDGGYVATDSLRKSDAASLVAMLGEAGIEASRAPDQGAHSLFWVYAVLD